MKKIRIVILSITAFSLFCSLFFNLSYVIYDKVYECDNVLINSVNRTISSHCLTFIILFLVTLGWYLYHKKDRPESVTNFMILLLYIAYSVSFVFDIIDLVKTYKEVVPTSGTPEMLSKYLTYEICYNFSLVILAAPGVWIIVLIIPAFFHFVASVCTGGFDNVPEPDNIYGFMYTVIGICYIVTFIMIGFITSIEDFTIMFALNDNGLIMTVIILSFILCAGLRFNSIVLNIFNIVANQVFIFVWLVILIYNTGYGWVERYHSIYHFVFIIPMSVLAVFILIHYLRIDRFYKGRTKNFINEK